MPLKKTWDLPVSIFVERGETLLSAPVSCEGSTESLSNRPVSGWERLGAQRYRRSGSFLSPRLIQEIQELSFGRPSADSTAVRGKILGAIASQLDDLPRFECAIRNLLLMRVDQVSMAVTWKLALPVSSRPQVVELAMSIPEAVKTKKRRASRYFEERPSEA